LVKWILVWNYHWDYFSNVFSTAPTCATTIITLEPCALNDDFQDYMLEIYFLFKNIMHIDVENLGI
jgi:hypothetical protein